MRAAGGKGTAQPLRSSPGGTPSPGSPGAAAAAFRGARLREAALPPCHPRRPAGHSLSQPALAGRVAAAAAPLRRSAAHEMPQPAARHPASAPNLPLIPAGCPRRLPRTGCGATGMTPPLPARGYPRFLSQPRGPLAPGCHLPGVPLAPAPIAGAAPLPALTLRRCCCRTCFIPDPVAMRSPLRHFPSRSLRRRGGRRGSGGRWPARRAGHAPAAGQSWGREQRG